jgi:hypothetical protein
MSPTPQPEETSIIAEWAWKIAAAFMAFVGGIVAATWAVASKVQGYDDRLKVVETTQVKCQSETLKGIADKLDELPEKIEKKMEAGFYRVHERIDELWSGKNEHSRTHRSDTSETTRNIAPATKAP